MCWLASDRRMLRSTSRRSRRQGVEVGADAVQEGDDVLFTSLHGEEGRHRIDVPVEREARLSRANG